MFDSHLNERMNSAQDTFLHHDMHVCWPTILTMVYSLLTHWRYNSLVLSHHLSVFFPRRFPQIWWPEPETLHGGRAVWIWLWQGRSYCQCIAVSDPAQGRHWGRVQSCVIIMSYSRTMTAVQWRSISSAIFPLQSNVMEISFRFHPTDHTFLHMAWQYCGMCKKDCSNLITFLLE